MLRDDVLNDRPCHWFCERYIARIVRIHQHVVRILGLKLVSKTVCSCQRCVVDCSFVAGSAI